MNRLWTVMAVTLVGGLTMAALPPTAERLLFIGTYTGENSRGIYAFRFNDQSGALTPLGLAAETPNPSFLTTDTDGRFVFAVNETSSFGADRSGSVTSFRTNAANGRLTLINRESSRGADPCHLALDHTGRHLAVANYSGGTFAILPVGADGRLGQARTVLTNTGSGPNTSRQRGPHAHAVVFSDDNRFLLGVDLGIDRVPIYRFDAATGVSGPAPVANGIVTPGAGPRHLAFHPTEPLAFVINELSSTIDVMQWDGAAGRLTPHGTYSTLPDGFSGESATAEIAVHPGGHFVYGSNRGHDSIAVFALSGDGQLALVEHEPTRGRTPRNFAIDPSGRWLLVGNQNSNTLAVFRIDQVTGRLEPVGPLANVGAPVSILFMP